MVLEVLMSSASFCDRYHGTDNRFGLMKRCILEDTRNYSMLEILDAFLNLRFLEVASGNRSTSLLCIFSMQFQQLLKIEFRRLENLHLADVHLLIRYHNAKKIRIIHFGEGR